MLNKKILFLLLVYSVSIFAVEKTECERDLEGTVLRIEKMVSLLKVANLKGDLKLATERESTLGAIVKGCPKELLPVVCGIECHYQRGRFYQFLSIATLYMPEVSSAQTFDPQKSQEYADKGAEILEEGIRFLNLKRSDPIREFTEKLIKLQSVRIEIYMLMGDFWYQTASQHLLKKLDFSVNKALRISDNNSNVNWGRANMYYSIKALPAIIDALTDIPDASTYNSLRTTIKNLHYNLQIRIKSIQKGKLFLDLDPEEFTSIDYQSLKATLDGDLQKMKEIEEKIHQMSKGWFDSKTNTNIRQIDEDRYQKGQSVALAVHSVGKIEAEAHRQFSDLNKIELEIQKDSEESSYKHQVRKLEVELAKRVKEFEFKQKMVSKRTESDLIGMDEKCHTEKRNEIRWLMNWKLSEMNLELQMNSIKNQFEEYRRQQISNIKQINEIEIGIKQKAISIENSELKIDEINQKLKQLDKQQQDIFVIRQQMLKEDICKVEHELAFTGHIHESSPFTGDQACIKNKSIYNGMNESTFLKIMCGDGANGKGLRNLKNETRIKSLNELGSLTEQEKVLLNEITQKKVSSLEKQIKLYEDSLNKINKAIELIIKSSDISKIQNGLDSIISAGAALSIACDMPYISMTAGPFSGGITTHTPKPERIARAVFDLALTVGKWELSTNKIKYTRGIDLSSKEQDLLNLQRQINTALDDVSIFKINLKSEVLQNTVRSLSYSMDADSTNQENTILKIDCDHQRASLSHQINSLLQEHKRLVLSRSMDAKQNDLIDYEKSQLTTQKQQIALDINSIKMDLDKLTLQRNHFSEDNATLESLKKNLTKSENLITKTKDSLQEMASESTRESSIIDGLFSKQRNFVMALSDDEIGFAKDSIDNHKVYFNDFLNLFKESKKYKEMDLEIKNKIEDLNKKTTDYILNEHKKIQDYIGQDDLSRFNGRGVNSKEYGDAILLSENEMEHFFRGIPDLVNTKKTLTEYANHSFLLMKIKRNSLYNISGEDKQVSPTFYRNSQQFEDDLRQMNESWIKQNSSPVQIGFFTVVIPQTSNFIYELLKKGSVNFEVSKNWSLQKMKRSGYKVVGDESVLNLSSVHLIDVLASTSFDIEFKKFSHSLYIKYLGEGFYFKRDYENETPDLYVGKSKNLNITLYDIKDNVIDQVRRYWSSVFFPTMFEEKSLAGPVNDPQKAFKLMGGPLFGRYEIAMDDMRGVGHGDIELTFIYSYRR